MEKVVGHPSPPGAPRTPLTPPKDQAPKQATTHKHKHASKPQASLTAPAEAKERGSHLQMRSQEAAAPGQEHSGGFQSFNGPRNGPGHWGPSVSCMGQGIRSPGHWGQPPMGQTSVMVESQLLSWHPPKPTHAYIHAHTSNEMSPKGSGEDPAGFTTFPVETPILGQWSKEKVSPGGNSQAPGLLLTHSPCRLTLGRFQNPVCVAFCSAKLLKARSEAKSKLRCC